MLHLILYLIVQALRLHHGAKSIYCAQETGCKATCDTGIDCSNRNVYCPFSTSCKECTIDCKHNKYCKNARIFGNECNSITIINSNKTVSIENMTINANLSSLLTLNTNGLIHSTIVYTQTKTEAENPLRLNKQKEVTVRLVCDSNGENTFLNNLQFYVIILMQLHFQII